jgi:hypothetical protein
MNHQSQQKVPLNLACDPITPSYLSALRVIVLRAKVIRLRRKARLREA